MSKAEDYITQNTKTLEEYGKEYFKWLTPDQARRAVEIAREEIYEWLKNVSFDDYKIADEESYRMGCPYDYIEVEKLINDIKQAMKDE